jgi:hypothetical protein
MWWPVVGFFLFLFYGGFVGLWLLDVVDFVGLWWLVVVVLLILLVGGG